ncbi:MAG: hypothetical protein RL199_1777 [Pseudomonadota bacterium]|jgi:cell division protein FtsA
MDGHEQRSAPFRVAGVDIGSVSTKVIVVERLPEGARVVTAVEEPSRGVKGHAVVSLQEVAAVLSTVLSRASEEANGPIDEVVCGVSRRHADIATTVGVAEVRSGVVGDRDLEKVHQSARAGLVASDRAELHLLVDRYRVGSTGDVQSPLGIHGRRLEAWGRIVTADHGVLRNFARSAEAAGFQVSRFALGSLLAAEALLAREERGGSVCLVDMGGESTEYIYFVGGVPVHSGLVPIGGDRLTSDLVEALRTPTAAAERIKREHGSAHESAARKVPVEVPGFGDSPVRSLEERVLCDVLEPRAREIFDLIRHDLDRAGLPSRPNFGYVLAGGGALLRGIDLTAEDVLAAPVRRASAISVESSSQTVSDPRFAVALGLASADGGARLSPRGAGLAGKLRALLSTAASF